MVIAFRRLAQSRRNDASFLVAGQKLLHRRLLALDSIERLLEALLDESLTQPFHSARPTRICVCDTLIGPIRTIRVGPEQNLGTPHLLRVKSLSCARYAALLAA